MYYTKRIMVSGEGKAINIGSCLLNIYIYNIYIEAEAEQLELSPPGVLVNIGQHYFNYLSFHSLENMRQEAKTVNITADESFVYGMKL